MQVGATGQDPRRLAGQRLRRPAVRVPALAGLDDHQHVDRAVRPCVQDVDLHPPIGGQAGECGHQPGPYGLEIEQVGQRQQRGARDHPPGRTGDVDHHRRAPVVEGSPGDLAAQGRYGARVSVPSDQAVDAAEGEQTSLASLIDHGHHRHVAVLVAAVGIDLVQDRDHRGQQSLGTQTAGGIEGVDSGVRKQGTDTRISGAVILREGGRRQGASAPQTPPLTHAVRLREHNRAVTPEPQARPRWVVLTALIMVAINLRMALASLPAVVTDIQDSTGWSDVAIGTLTTIPVLCMGAFALVVPRIARAIGRRETVALALLLLTIALSARLFATVPGVLHVSVLFAGIGIALAAGLVPSIVREQLPDAVGAATGLWSSTMMLGAALAGALTAPLALWLGSWQRALAFWALPAAIGLVVWWLVETRHHAPDGARGAGESSVRIKDLPWRHRTAWALTAYLAFNSIVFYTSLAWLAPSYVQRGWTQVEAGWLLGLFAASQVVAALVMPHLAERSRARRTIYAACVTLAALAALAIGWAPTTFTLAVIIVYGAALGAGFAMGLALLSEYGATGPASARLTAMAFSITYLSAALGPIAAGGILDAFDSWPSVFTMLSIVLVAQLLTVPALRRGIHVP